MFTKWLLTCDLERVTRRIVLAGVLAIAGVLMTSFPPMLTDAGARLFDSRMETADSAGGGTLCCLTVEIGYTFDHRPIYATFCWDCTPQNQPQP